MNKVLYIARKAKGYTYEQLAKLLHMTETDYREMELSLHDVSAEQARKLSKLFVIEAEHFLFNEMQSTRILKIAMDEVANIIESTKNNMQPPVSYFSIVKLGNKALLLQAELNHELYRRCQLEEDIEHMKSLYLKLKEETIDKK